MAVSVTNGTTTIVAEGETALRLLFLREQFADSALWRALVALPRSDWNAVKAKSITDDASRNDALAAILLDRWGTDVLNADPGDEAPRILLRPYDESSIDWTAPGSWEASDLYLMMLHIPIPENLREEADVPVAAVDFWNKADTILKQCLVAGNYAPERVPNPVISRIVLPGEIDPVKNNARRVRQAIYAIQCRGPNT